MDSSRYRFVEIPKRSGGTRTLEIPEPGLMARQRTILRWLMARRLAASPYAHGFVRLRSIVTNARPHVGKKVVIRIDLEDFFPSVKASMVREALAASSLSRETIEEIVELCTLDGRLPQGAPTSPFLANLVAVRLDHRLAGLARKWRGGNLRTVYTRYADDLCFSSHDPHLNHIIAPVRRIIEDSRFKLNRRKTRVYRQGIRQIVAGVVVNDRPNVPRSVRRNLRAELHQMREAILRGEFPQVDVQRLRGLAAHVHAVNSQTGIRFIRDVDEIERLVTVSKI